MRLSAALVAISTVLFSLPLAAAARDYSIGALQILDAHAVGRARGAPVEVYMTVVNSSDSIDRIIDAYVPGARKAELHNDVVAGKVTTTPEVEDIPVPAHGKVDLRPGGYRIMVFDLPRSVHPGDPIPMEIEFELAGRANIAPVLSSPDASAKTTSGQPTDTPSQ